MRTTQINMLEEKFLNDSERVIIYLLRNPIQEDQQEYLIFESYKPKGI